MMTAIERSAKWRAAHPERAIAVRRKWNAAHREENAARSRAYHAAHRAESLAKCKAYAASHPEQTRARNKAYRAAHLEKAIADGKAYRADNPEKMRALYQAYRIKHNDLLREKALADPHRAARWAKRRAAKLKAAPPWVDTAAIEAVYREARRLSRDTGVDHHVDHIYPLQGRTVCGLHVSANLQILTKAENQRKGNKHPMESAA